MKTYQLHLKTILALLIFSMCFASTVQGSRYQDSQPQPPKVIRKSGGVLQGSAIRRVEPAYPPLAKAARIEGAVVVEVMVDEEGGVIRASAVSGHPLLKDASVAAARGWKFSPTKLEGRNSVKVPVKVIGTITFNYTLGNGKEIEALKAEAATHPDSAEVYFKLGEAYLADTDANATNAAESFKRAIRLKPDYADAYLKLGESYCIMHMFEGKDEHTREEIEALEQAIRLRPDLVEAYIQLARAHTYSDPSRIEENRQAIEILKQAIKMWPDNADLYRSLAMAHLTLNQYDEVILALRNVSRIEPDPETSRWVARICVKTGRYDEAIEAYKQILREHPSIDYVHAELGMAYLAQGNRELAMKEYEALKGLGSPLAEELLKAINK
jgi:TonB family protein